MGASSELFLRMTEEEYFSIPEDIRQRHLSYKTLKETKKCLSEREFQLREERRKINK